LLLTAALRSAGRAAAATALFTAALATAAPTTGQGAPLTGDATAPASSADTPQDRAFREGVQAQLKGDWPGAKRGFEASLKLSPGFVPALIGLAGVAQAEGRASAAEDLLKQAERASPKSWEVHLAWGRLYLSQNAPDQAEKAFQKANAMAPKAVPPWLELGDLQLRRGRANDALKAYRQAAALDERNKFAAYGRGVAAAAAGQRAEALLSLATAAGLAPNDPAPLRASGRIHLESGDLAKAMADFDRGLERQPKFVPLMLDRAEVLARQQRWPDAIAQVQAAEQLAPADLEVQMKLADIYQGARRWDEAEARYLKVIGLAPKLPFPYNNLAWMTVARGGDAAKAVRWARQAVALSPNSSPFHDTLGWAQRAAGDLPGATTSLQQAIKLEPGVAGYHHHLGVLQAEQKNVVAARASLKKALELDPKLPQADEVRRLLAQLGAG
jgi:tetratricopeptide (TPR) repeat protein